MKITIQLKARSSGLKSTDALVFFLSRQQPETGLFGDCLKNNPHFREALKSKEFGFAEEKILAFHTPGKSPVRRYVFAGLGEAKDFEPDTLRKTAAKVIKKSAASEWEQILIELPAAPEDSGLNEEQILRILTEGLILGHYRFDRYRKKNSPKSKIVVTVFVSRITPELRSGLRLGMTVSESVCFSRDLSNTPSADCTPSLFAREIRRMAAGKKLNCKVFAETQLKRMGMNGILSVARGSAEPSCLVQLTYKPQKAVNRRPLVLAGKGITFDSGGLNIKTGNNMDGMKMDMAGGSAVAGIMKAVAELKLPVHLIGLVPLAENMPGPRAVKPGDIIRMHSGATVEIANTDAEGRLLLADAISFARSFNPEAIIDLATLTSACLVALGTYAAGMMGTSDEWKRRIRGASVITSERVWELPLWKEIDAVIKSPVADLKNTGNRWGGAINAGAFLKAFAGQTPWVHLDIAGTADTEEELAYCGKNQATGFGVRLITEMLLQYIQEK